MEVVRSVIQKADREKALGFDGFCYAFFRSFTLNCLSHIQILLVSFLQVGKHGIIIEFSDPDYNTRRSATYLPEVAAQEGNLCSPIKHCLTFGK